MLKKLLLLSICVVGFVACESDEDKKTASAQDCMNSATSTTVDACVAMVDGVGTNQANKIRCAADFLRADINEDRIVEALDQLDKKNTDTTKNATASFMSKFRFSDADGANQAVVNCTSTGSQTLVDLANAAKTATLIFVLSNGAVDLQAWADGLTDGQIDGLDPDQLVGIGETVLALQPSLCGASGQFEDNKVCVDLNEAIGNNDAAAIAAALIKKFKEHD